MSTTGVNWLYSSGIDMKLEAYFAKRALMSLAIQPSQLSRTARYRTASTVWARGETAPAHEDRRMASIENGSRTPISLMPTHCRC